MRLRQHGSWRRSRSSRARHYFTEFCVQGASCADGTCQSVCKWGCGCTRHLCAQFLAFRLHVVLGCARIYAGSKGVPLRRIWQHALTLVNGSIGAHRFIVVIAVLPCSGRIATICEGDPLQSVMQDEVFITAPQWAHLSLAYLPLCANRFCSILAATTVGRWSSDRGRPPGTHLGS